MTKASMTHACDYVWTIRGLQSGTRAFPRRQFSADQRLWAIQDLSVEAGGTRAACTSWEV